MKNFLVFILLWLCFAVCFAAPPPQPDVVSHVEIVMPDCKAMPVMVQEVTCYLQPAPLIVELELNGYMMFNVPFIAEIINNLYLVKKTKQHDNLIEANLISTNRRLNWNSPIYNHTSRGMPY